MIPARTLQMIDGSTAPKAQGESPLLKQVRFIKAVTADREVTAHGKAVANALVFVFWNKDEGYARPGHAKIAEAAGIAVTMVKKGIKSLQARGWFCVQPAFDAAGDPAPNHYYPVWKRAEGKAPAGSERPRRAPRAPKATASPITFEAGVVRLTAVEVADIEAKVGIYATPFFDGLKRNPPQWPEATWRIHFASTVATWSEPEETDETEPDQIDETALGEDILG